MKLEISKTPSIVQDQKLFENFPNSISSKCTPTVVLPDVYLENRHLGSLKIERKHEAAQRTKPGTRIKE